MSTSPTPLTSAQRIASIVARAAAVPAAEWNLDGPDYHFYGDGESEYVHTSLISAEDRTAVVFAAAPTYPNKNEAAFVEWMPTAEANLAFIAHSRADVTWLLEQLAESEARADSLAAQLANDGR